MNISLREFQQSHARWARKNFPHQGRRENRYHSFLGVMEEVGELAHTCLKYEQRIREFGGLNDYEAEALVKEQLEDGVGDLMIFLAGCCDVWEIDMEHALAVTWDKVSKRDWATDHTSGGEG